MTVTALVLLFLIWIRFVHPKPVEEVIRKRYGQRTFKKLRKLEKLDYRKAQIDLEFLVSCGNISVPPKFLNFRNISKVNEAYYTKKSVRKNLI